MRNELFIIKVTYAFQDKLHSLRRVPCFYTKRSLRAGCAHYIRLEEVILDMILNKLLVGNVRRLKSRVLGVCVCFVMKRASEGARERKLDGKTDKLA